MKEFYAMISANLFRRLPNIPIRGPLDANDTVFDLAWPHLQLCYQLVLSSIPVPHTQACLTPVFISKLVGNGLCLDDNEKVMVRDVLLAIYTRFMNLRGTIRTCIGYYFSTQQCSRELLEFFANCINTFNSPLKPEHIKFFTCCLNPLHSDPKMFLYIDPLLDCLDRMITKQPKLLEDVFKYMSRHWPCGERAKQLTYLDEVKHLLLAHTKLLTPDLVKMAFQIMALGAYNECSDVCDFVLLNLTDNKVIDVILTHAALIYPLIFESLCRAARSHWDEAIRTNTFVALQALQAIDPVVFKKMNEERGGVKKLRTTVMSTFQGNWMQVFQLAKENDNTIQEASFESVLKVSAKQ
jgi:serine/threonine-protein phosphatase 2A regulatory subunit B'